MILKFKGFTFKHFKRRNLDRNGRRRYKDAVADGAGATAILIKQVAEHQIEDVAQYKITTQLDDINRCKAK